MSASITPAASRAGRVADRQQEDDVRWSTRRVAAFVIVVCGAFWLAVGALAAYLIDAM